MERAVDEVQAKNERLKESLDEIRSEMSEMETKAASVAQEMGLNPDGVEHAALKAGKQAAFDFAEFVSFVSITILEVHKSCGELRQQMKVIEERVTQQDERIKGLEQAQLATEAAHPSLPSAVSAKSSEDLQSMEEPQVAEAESAATTLPSPATSSTMPKVSGSPKVKSAAGAPVRPKAAPAVVRQRLNNEAPAASSTSPSIADDAARLPDLLNIEEDPFASAAKDPWLPKAQASPVKAKAGAPKATPKKLGENSVIEAANGPPAEVKSAPSVPGPPPAKTASAGAGGVTTKPPPPKPKPKPAPQSLHAQRTSSSEAFLGPASPTTSRNETSSSEGSGASGKAAPAAASNSSPGISELPHKAMPVRVHGKPKQPKMPSSDMMQLLVKAAALRGGAAGAAEAKAKSSQPKAPPSTVVTSENLLDMDSS